MCEERKRGKERKKREKGGGEGGVTLETCEMSTLIGCSRVKHHELLTKVTEDLTVEEVKGEE